MSNYGVFYLNFRSLLLVAVNFVDVLMQFLDHFPQQHVFLSVQAVLIVLDEQILHVFLEQFAFAFQFSQVRQFSPLPILFSASTRERSARFSRGNGKL
jgi:hypothetical protein